MRFGIAFLLGLKIFLLFDWWGAAALAALVLACPKDPQPCFGAGGGGSGGKGYG